jgi:hypothetical protein
MIDTQPMKVTPTVSHCIKALQQVNDQLVRAVEPIGGVREENLLPSILNLSQPFISISLVRPSGERTLCW